MLLFIVADYGAVDEGHEDAALDAFAFDADPGNLSATIRGFDYETHGSVISHILSSGIRELWGTGKGFVEAMLESTPAPAE